MPRLRRIPLDPSTALLESIARVIREGVPHCDTITAPDNVPWVEDQLSPAGHYLVPAAGWHLYLDREPEKVQTPAIVVTCHEDGKLRNETVKGMWGIAVLVRLLAPRDLAESLLDDLIQRLQIVLCETLTLNDTTRQPPQARLSTPTLALDGSRREDNFLNTSTGKIEDTEGHPERALGFTVLCGLISP